MYYWSPSASLIKTPQCSKDLKQMTYPTVSKEDCFYIAIVRLFFAAGLAAATTPMTEENLLRQAQSKEIQKLEII